MNGKSTELRIRWPFAPDTVNTNRDTTFLKIIAMLTMFCDHAGKMLFPQYRIMRIIGRVAFPIFAYCIAVGCVYTHDMLRYLKRIVLLALITQPIYAVALNHSVQSMYTYSFAEHPVLAAVRFYVYSWVAQPSILLSLCVGVVMIWCLRERHFSLLIGLAIIVWHGSRVLDYGWKGVALMLIFYMTCTKPLISFVCAAGFLAWWGINQGNSYQFLGVSFGIETFALFALPFIYIQPRTMLRDKLKLPKWLFYGFYPVHMIIIYALDNYVLK